MYYYWSERRPLLQVKGDQHRLFYRRSRNITPSSWQSNNDRKFRTDIDWENAREVTYGEAKDLGFDPDEPYPLI